MSLPTFNTTDKPFSLMQSNWASQLNPILANPTNNSSILKNIQLIVGTNTINHLLGKNLTGWNIVRKRGPAEIYDNQDTNQMPNLTLTLISDASVSVDIEVF